MTQPTRHRAALLRGLFAGVFELVGLACVTVGLWWLAPWLSMVVLGLGLIVIGQAIDHNPKADLGVNLDTPEEPVKPKQRRDPSEPPPPGLDWRPQIV